MLDDATVVVDDDGDVVDDVDDDDDVVSETNVDVSYTTRCMDADGSTIPAKFCKNVYFRRGLIDPESAAILAIAAGLKYGNG